MQWRCVPKQSCPTHSRNSATAKYIDLLVVHPGQRSLRLSDLQPWHSDLTNYLLDGKRNSASEVKEYQTIGLMIILTALSFLLDRSSITFLVLLLFFVFILGFYFIFVLLSFWSSSLPSIVPKLIFKSPSFLFWIPEITFCVSILWIYCRRIFHTSESFSQPRFIVIF